MLQFPGWSDCLHRAHSLRPTFNTCSLVGDPDFGCINALACHLRRNGKPLSCSPVGRIKWVFLSFSKPTSYNSPFSYLFCTPGPWRPGRYRSAQQAAKVLCTRDLRAQGETWLFRATSCAAVLSHRALPQPCPAIFSQFAPQQIIILLTASLWKGHINLSAFSTSSTKLRSARISFILFCSGVQTMTPTGLYFLSPFQTHKELSLPYCSLRTGSKNNQSSISSISLPPPPFFFCGSGFALLYSQNTFYLNVIPFFDVASLYEKKKN